MLARSANGAVAVYIPGFAAGSSYSGGTIQVQGSTGRINVPVTFGSAAVDFSKAYSVAGATSSGTVGYTLLAGASPSTNSTLILSDVETGAYLTTRQLDASLSDIAYTNGQIYGIGATSTALQVVSIGTDGKTHSVINQSMPSSTAPWRLSGVSSGSGLLAARGSFSATNLPGYVIDPVAASVSQIALSGTANSPLNDMVINTAGSAVTAIGPFSQPITSYPGGVAQGSVPSNARYGTGFVSNSVSDEFNFNYLPTLPAAAQTMWNATISPLQGVTDGLTRTPQVVSLDGPVTISNHVAPDGTTLSNVAAVLQVSQFFGTGFGHTPFVTSVTNAAPADFSDRVIGQASASLDLATAERGLYSVGVSPNLTADYSYAATVDHGRAVQAVGAAGTQFAYEPISANLVGNGDAFLNGAGWQGYQGSSPSFQSQVVNSDPANHTFYLTTQAGFPAAIRQFLQLPTPNAPMFLSFTYGIRSDLPGGPDDLRVSLNGVLLGDITASGTSLQTFQTEIDDPSLMNQANVVLMFQSSTTGPVNFLNVGNISLTAVPEPAMASSLLAIACGSALLRRRSRLRRN
jgi:hypothetical protein